MLTDVDAVNHCREGVAAESSLPALIQRRSKSLSPLPRRRNKKKPLVSKDEVATMANGDDPFALDEQPAAPFPPNRLELMKRPWSATTGPLRCSSPRLSSSSWEEVRMRSSHSRNSSSVTTNSSSVNNEPASFAGFSDAQMLASGNNVFCETCALFCERSSFPPGRESAAISASAIAASAQPAGAVGGAKRSRQHRKSSSWSKHDRSDASKGGKLSELLRKSSLATFAVFSNARLYGGSNKQKNGIPSGSDLSRLAAGEDVMSGSSKSRSAQAAHRYNHSDNLSECSQHSSSVELSGRVVASSGSLSFHGRRADPSRSDSPRNAFGAADLSTDASSIGGQDNQNNNNNSGNNAQLCTDQAGSNNNVCQRSSSPRPVADRRSQASPAVAVNNSSPQTNTSTGAKIQSVLNATQRFLNPTYKTRAEEFHRLFKDMPETEKFVIDYSCALQREILVQGRVYISINYICFYANILKWETNLKICLKDVTSITKEKTAKVIPNAVQICTKTGEKHFLTSFTSREKAYLVMFKLWQYSLLDEPVSPSELNAWAQEYGLQGDDEAPFELASECSAEANASLPCGSEEDDEPTVADARAGVCYNVAAEKTVISSAFLAPLEKDKTKSSTPLLPCGHSAPSASVLAAARLAGFGYPGGGGEPVEFIVGGERLSSNELGADLCSPTSLPTPRSAPHLLAVITQQDGASTSQQHNEGSKHSPANTSSISTSSRSPRGNGYASGRRRTAPRQASKGSPAKQALAELSDSSDGEGEIACKCVKHEGREMVNTVYPVSADQLFLLVFTDSAFFRNLQDFRNTTDLAINDWQNDNASGTKQRQLNYTVALNNAMAPKSAAVSEKQTVSKDSIPGRLYVIESEAHNFGVLYSETFYIATTYCVSRVSANQSRLRIHGSVQYKKSCWGFVKSFLEKNALAGHQDFCNDLDSKLRQECQRLGLALAEDESSVKRTLQRRRAVRSRRDDRAEQPQQSDHKLASVGGAHHQRQASFAQGEASVVKKNGICYPLVTTEMEHLARGILIVLILMLLLNAFLFYKLWTFESNVIASSSSDDNRLLDAKLLQDLRRMINPDDSSNNDWLNAWIEDRIQQRRQFQKWSDVLDASLHNIETIESSLVLLKQKMKLEQIRQTDDSVLASIAAHTRASATDKPTASSPVSAEDTMSDATCVKDDSSDDCSKS